MILPNFSNKGQVLSLVLFIKIRPGLCAVGDGCNRTIRFVFTAESSRYTQLTVSVLSVPCSWLLCTSWNEEDLALLVPEEVSSIDSVDS